jgi:DNA mismatch endonuclease, patch repair protein
VRCAACAGSVLESRFWDVITGWVRDVETTQGEDCAWRRGFLAYPRGHDREVAGEHSQPKCIGSDSMPGRVITVVAIAVRFAWVFPVAYLPRRVSHAVSHIRHETVVDTSLSRLCYRLIAEGFAMANRSDRLSVEARSLLMARIHAKDTKPELQVRRLLFSLGYRYRLHRADLPGKPDIVFAARKKVVFVHGCFWHRHGCHATYLPKGNAQYWSQKFEHNMARDQRNQQELGNLGWQYLVVWECELADPAKVRDVLIAFLEEE